MSRTIPEVRTHPPSIVLIPVYSIVVPPSFLVCVQRHVETEPTASFEKMYGGDGRLDLRQPLPPSLVVQLYPPSVL
jgi:hypothetical protein